MLFGSVGPSAKNHRLSQVAEPGFQDDKIPTRNEGKSCCSFATPSKGQRGCQMNLDNTNLGNACLVCLVDIVSGFFSHYVNSKYRESTHMSWEY